MENILVSVIIPSFNRFITLNNTIESILNQTHKNIEIIVVNDGSTDERYYKENDNFKMVNLLNLTSNSKIIYGFPNIGYVVNQGLKIAKGKYICCIGDDDLFMPTKIEEQLRILEEKNYKTCCTDGYMFERIFNKDIKNTIYIEEHYIDLYKKMLNISHDLPTVWNSSILAVHNFIIASSVMFHKDIIKLVGYFSESQDVLGCEDYNYWKRIVEQVGEIYYINKPLVAYDTSHGVINRE
jgi:glycosyltransferase involved in cell wall biosynthesis